LAVAVLVLVGGFFGYRYFSASGSRQINSIAVLPFENRSGNSDTDYLSDGLADSLIYRLSQLPSLKVSPTSSVMRYKGKGGDTSQIAKELNVDAVMTGRLVQLGDSLNVSIQLTDARTDKLIWAEQYDRKMADLLATQREIAATIAEKLQIKLSGTEKAITKKYTDNSEAYQLYLKGRFHFAKRTKADMFRSIELYRESIALDPNFALAHIGVAESFVITPSYPYMSAAEAFPQAKTAVAKALELDAELPEAHSVAGMLAMIDWDWAEAERRFKRSLELDPNVAETHYRYALAYLSTLGRHDDAITEMKRAMELEPLSIIQGAYYAAVLMYARQFDAALDQARKTYDLDTSHVGARSWLGYTLNAKGLYAETLAMAEKTLQEPNFAMLPHAAFAYAKTDQRDKAEQIITRFKIAEKTRAVPNYWIAVTYGALGEKDKAFAELEIAYRERDWFLPRMKVDPFMDPLRDDPRFEDLLKRIGLPE
jgi:TolB-like protein/Tfp pilus assembly protein PilF